MYKYPPENCPISPSQRQFWVDDFSIPKVVCWLPERNLKSYPSWWRNPVPLAWVCALPSCHHTHAAWAPWQGQVAVHLNCLSSIGPQLPGRPEDGQSQWEYTNGEVACTRRAVKVPHGTDPPQQAFSPLPYWWKMSLSERSLRNVSKISRTGCSSEIPAYWLRKTSFWWLKTE